MSTQHNLEFPGERVPARNRLHWVGWCACLRLAVLVYVRRPFRVSGTIHQAGEPEMFKSRETELSIDRQVSVHGSFLSALLLTVDVTSCFRLLPLWLPTMIIT